MKKLLAIATVTTVFIFNIADARPTDIYHCTNKEYQVNIPSLNLEKALSRFTTITHCPVSIEVQRVANTDAKELPSFPVKGRFTPDRILKDMLSSSPLKAKQVRSGYLIYLP